MLETSKITHGCQLWERTLQSRMILLPHCLSLSCPRSSKAFTELLMALEQRTEFIVGLN